MKIAQECEKPSVRSTVKVFIEGFKWNHYTFNNLLYSFVGWSLVEGNVIIIVAYYVGCGFESEGVINKPVAKTKNSRENTFAFNSLCGWREENVIILFCIHLLCSKP